MTVLMGLLDTGWDVKISEMVQPGTPFVHDDPYTLEGFLGHPLKPVKMIVFHPLDYNYIAYESYLDAHEKNMDWIRNWIEDRAAQAMRRIDEMVDGFNRKWDVQEVHFYTPTTAVENEDGTWSFVPEVLDLAYAPIDEDAMSYFTEEAPGVSTPGVKITLKEETDEDR